MANALRAPSTGVPGDLSLSLIDLAQEDLQVNILPAPPPLSMSLQTPVPQLPLPGGANLHGTKYATNRRAFLALMRSLKGTGTTLLDIEIPRIAVIGNQSAGKSSLVEGISQIKVPRDGGSCTRCPFEVRLQNADTDWTCQVRLRFESGLPLAERGATRVQEIDFGPPLRDPSAVETVLKRAQLAVLNPDVRPETFLQYDLAKLDEGRFSAKQHRFTRNIVCCDVVGRDMTDLLFVDLPGIILNSTNDDPRLIQNLVRQYIASSTLILLVLPMHDDIETQTAAALAREVDPNGMRTIGVITKPDWVKHGDMGDWLRVLRGEKDRLRYGYYVTKQPGADERRARVPWALARKQEEEFFRRTEPWATASPAIKARLGTPNLVRALSELLIMIVARKYPDLSATVTNQQRVVTDRLARLPTISVDDPTKELLRLITALVTDIERNVKAVPGYVELWHACQDTFAIFKASIWRTLPVFIPFEVPTVPGERAELVALWDAEWDACQAELPDDLPRAIKGFENGPRDRMFLPEIRAIVRQSLGRELQPHVPFSVTAALIRRPFQAWERCLRQLFSTVKGLVSAAFSRCIDRHFGHFMEGPLRNQVIVIVSEQVDAVASACRNFLEAMLKMESAPLTQNDDYLSFREKRLAALRQPRSALAAAHLEEWERQEHVGAITNHLANLGINAQEGDLAKLLPRDPWDPELLVCADTSAYLYVAYKRMIDYFPMAIDHHFLRPLPTRIQAALMRGLKVEDREVARVYFQENAALVKEREELAVQRARLEQARATLSRLEADVPVSLAA